MAAEQSGFMWGDYCSADCQLAEQSCVGGLACSTGLGMAAEQHEVGGSACSAGQGLVAEQPRVAGAKSMWVGV